MSSEHPLEEQELHRVDAGEQGLTAEEKELIALRNRVRELEAEVSVRRNQAEKDLRFMAGRIDEVTHLKRRLALMRAGLRGLAGPNCLSDVDEYQRGAAADLKSDDAVRRRFEQKHKARRR